MYCIYFLLYLGSNYNSKQYTLYYRLYVRINGVFSDFCMNERTEKVCVVHVRFVFLLKVLYSVAPKCFITVNISVMYTCISVILALSN